MDSGLFQALLHVHLNLKMLTYPILFCIYIKFPKIINQHKLFFSCKNPCLLYDVILSMFGILITHSKAHPYSSSFTIMHVSTHLFAVKCL